MRYTETKLDKLIRIHHGMVDNIINQACKDLEAIKPAEPSYTFFEESWLTDSRIMGQRHRDAQRRYNMQVSCIADGIVWSPVNRNLRDLDFTRDDCC